MLSEELIIIKTEDDTDMEEPINNDNNELSNDLFSQKNVKTENVIKEEKCEEENIDDTFFAENTKYLCEICNSYYSSLYNLQNHMQGHDINSLKEYKIKNELETETFLREENIDQKFLAKDNGERFNDTENTRDKLNKTRKECVIEEIDEEVNSKEETAEKNIITDKNIHIVKNKRKNNHSKGKSKDKSIKKNQKSTKSSITTDRRKKLKYSSDVEINEHDKSELVDMIISDCVVEQKDHKKGKELIESQHDTNVDIGEGNKENISEELNNATKQIHKQFTCDICCKTYKTNGSLQTHVKEIHIGSKSKSRSTVNCDLCSKSYSRKEYLEQHVRKYHLKIKKGFKCEFCGQYYCDKRALRRHKIYNCSENFNRKVSKGVKMATFRCKLCKNKYVNSETFENHTINHPKYICGYCDRVFYVKYYLIKHIKNKHLNLRHRCELCGNEYVTRYNLNKHLKSKKHISLKEKCMNP